MAGISTVTSFTMTKHFHSLYILALAFALAGFTQTASASSEDDSMLAKALSPLTSAEVQHGVILPFKARHLSDQYSSQLKEKLNEENYGLGYSRSKTFGRHQNEWYLMGFNDSFHKLSVQAGYRYQFNVLPSNDWKLGVGFTAGVISKREISNGNPNLFVLPSMGFGYKNVEVGMVYVPELSRTVNELLFFWATIKF